MKKKVVIGTFFAIIMLPIILAIGTFLTGNKYEVKLNGNFDTIEKPKMTASSYIDGEFQALYQNWFNQNMQPRSVFIKTYNQINYSLFHMGNCVIGKNGYVYEEFYINDQLNIAGSSDTAKRNNAIKEYVGHLESIQEKLSRQGKYLLVYTTPSKGEYHYNEIPYRFKVRETEESRRGIEVFQDEITKTRVNYLDTCTLIPEEHVWPVYYKAGVHWSRPFEQIANHAVIDKLSEISGMQFHHDRLGELETSDEPYWRDSDVFDLLNVWTQRPEELYYQYRTVGDKQDIPKDSCRILIQGGSFSAGLNEDHFRTYLSDERYYINYDNWIMEPDGKISTFEAWNELDLGKYLDSVDFVVIELNESVVCNCSNGYVTYLDEYLNHYVSQEMMREYPMRLVPSEKSGLECARGYYGYEDTHIWAKKNSIVTLKNSNISKSGLSIQFKLYDYLFLDREQVNISVIVNGKLVDEEQYMNSGEKTINISGENLPIDEKDIYSIQIRSDGEFTPYQIGINDDKRNLAVAVLYIGEVQ